MFSIVVLLCLSFSFENVLSDKLPQFHDPYFFPNRTGIVHLFEWKFLDIARECEEFLGPNGYAGVQTSPASENAILPGRPWFERYQPVSYEIRTRSGDAKEFFEMTQRCRAVGVRIYVDVVINHMTSNYVNFPIGTGGNFANALNFSYPSVPYNKDDFNQPTCQIENFSDPIQARNCELVQLHDLNQRKERVRWAIILFLDKLLALGAAGFRVDATKHMWPEDLEFIYDHVQDLPISQGFKPSSRPFIFQEVSDSWKFNYTQFGPVTEFSYPSLMIDLFRYHKDIKIIENIARNLTFLPTESSLIFVDNHDLQRANYQIITYKEPRLFKAAYALALAHNYGIPRVMSSFNFVTEQDGPPHDKFDNIQSPQFNATNQCTNGWICEHRWNAIKNMIKFRNIVGNSSVQNFWSNGNGVGSFCRGNKGFILINNGKSDFNGTIQTCLPNGNYCNVMIDDGKCNGNSTVFVVNKNGTVNINLPKNSTELVVALHVGAKL